VPPIRAHRALDDLLATPGLTDPGYLVSRE
jgi:hypothetical protein